MKKNYYKKKRRNYKPNLRVKGRVLIKCDGGFKPDLTPKPDKEINALKEAKKQFKKDNPKHDPELIGRFSC